MSWDIFVQDIPASVRSVAEMPDDFQPRLIGERAEIVARIREIAPAAVFKSPSWGQINGPGFSIEVSMGDREDIHSFTFHIFGGDLAPFVVGDILEHLGLRAFDPNSETGIFGLSEESATGLSKWRGYRDHALGQPS